MRTSLSIELSSRVRRNLARSKISQRELARRGGCTPKHISRALSGQDQGSVAFWDAALIQSGRR